jgi:hypothetical protein
MRNGKIATRPSASRDALKGRMERIEKEGYLMAWPNGLRRGSGPHPAIWVKPGQTWSNRFSPRSCGKGLHCPWIMLWVPCDNVQGMVVGPCADKKPGRQIAIVQSCAVTPGQTQSHLVKPGQSEKRGLTVKPQCAGRLAQITRKLPRSSRYN